MICKEKCFPGHESSQINRKYLPGTWEKWVCIVAHSFSPSTPEIVPPRALGWSSALGMPLCKITPARTPLTVASLPAHARTPLQPVFLQRVPDRLQCGDHSLSTLLPQSLRVTAISPLKLSTSTRLASSLLKDHRKLILHKNLQQNILGFGHIFDPHGHLPLKVLGKWLQFIYV